MSASKQFEQKLGSKCEIYLKKEIRKEMNLQPSDIVVITITGQKIIIEKKKRFKDIAKSSKKVKITEKQNELLDKELLEMLES